MIIEEYPVSLKSEYEILGRYNSEVARGIAHTPEWKDKMRELQDIYDARGRERWWKS